MTYCIDYHDGTYLLSSDTEDQVREAVEIGSPDVEVPDILESYLEYRFSRDKWFLVGLYGCRGTFQEDKTAIRDTA